jgi:hypothetical protein
VTYRMALWRCLPLYQATKRVIQLRPVSASAKGSCGYTAACFSVRNRASEYGLSFATCGAG